MLHRNVVRVVPAALVLAAGLALPAMGQVSFRTRPDAIKQVFSAAEVEGQIAALAARPDASRVVIQFSAPLSEAQKAALAASGVRLLGYLPTNAYFAHLDAGVNAGAAIAAAPIASVRAIDLAWKMHPDFNDGKVQPWTVVSGPEAAEPRVASYIMFHPDVALDAAAEALVEEVGGRVVDRAISANMLVIETEYSMVRRLAADDRVQWIEPALFKFDELNAENRNITGVNTVFAAPYNLTGAGIKAFVYDGGRVRATHQDFQGRATLLASDTSTTSNHATHVAGTVGGGGVVNPTHRGMAPGVQILSAGFQWSGGSGFLYTNPGDLEADYTAAFAWGADVTNNSIGTNTESNGYDCAWQGQYGLTDVLIDNIGRGSLGGDMIIVWAAGNERQGSRCDSEGYGDYYSSAPPSAAKNHITIGALNANDDSMTSFSSWGPQDDGRLCPVVSAPGCQSGGDGGVTSLSSSSDTAYTSLCGTSMASPTTAGIVALALQDFRAQNPSQPDPLGSTMKALLAHTAVDRGNVGPDYQFGYGSIRVNQLVDFMRSGQFGEDSVAQGQTKSFPIAVNAGQSQLKVTIAWPDAAATPNAAITLINDLDLVLRSPGGQEFNAWTLNPTNPSAPAVRTTANRRDNIEQVLVDNPQPGTWTIEVRGFNVPQGPQVFSIAGLPVARVSIAQLTTLPALLDPGVPRDLDVSISSTADTIVPGSTKLFYRFNSSAPYTAQDLIFLGGTNYRGTLPAPRCGESPEYYFGAEGATSGPVVSGTTVRGVGTVATLATDSMEVDAGWTPAVVGATTTGQWTRGVPGVWIRRGDPDADNDPTGAGFCWVTGNTSNEDLDGGPVTLTSPAFNLAGTVSPVLSYARWFYNDDQGVNPTEADVLTVEISTNNGASYSLLETVSASGTQWVTRSFPVAAVNGVRLRFTANDSPNNSVYEAGVDSILVTSTFCTYSCPADIDRSGAVDLADFFEFFGCYDAEASCADIDGAPGVDLGDFFFFFGAYDGGLCS